MRRTTITAHAGCENTPMNSLDSILSGIAIGADICELDVSALTDGTPVLKHNRPRRRETMLVPLAEALALLQDKSPGINLDIKDMRAVPGTLELVAGYHLENRAFFSGIGSRWAKVLRDVGSPIPYYLNHNVRANTGSRAIQALVKRVRNLGCIGVNTHYAHLNADIVAALHRSRLLVSAWTVEEESDMRRLLDMGVDNITTRSPQRLAAVQAATAPSPRAL